MEKTNVGDREGGSKVRKLEKKRLAGESKVERKRGFKSKICMEKVK